MASENTFTAVFAYDDGVTAETASITGGVFSAGATLVHKAIQSIPTSEAAINLGGVSSPTGLFLRNLDPTNYVDVKVGTSGAIFARLAPDTNSDGKGGFVCLSNLGSGAQVPYAISNSGACRILVQVAE